jgi:hypothetical protein
MVIYEIIIGKARGKREKGRKGERKLASWRVGGLSSYELLV